jgi:ribosomal protein S18 acetylase RimI-like enzyme
MKIAGLPFGTEVIGPAAYEISTDPARLDIAAIHAYLNRSYWSAGIPIDVVGRAIRHSLCFGIYETATGAQVGFARVVTDYATFAYLCDLYVLEEHRGRGLANRMMRTAMAHPALTGARRIMLATRDAHALYRKSGFTGAGTSGTLMEIVWADIYQSGAGSGCV